MSPALPLGAGVPRGLPDRGGFDAFVGNPPFMGGPKITGNLGTEYRDYFVRALALASAARPPVCLLFSACCGPVVRGRSVRLLATNTIAQGDTREVGLDQLTGNRPRPSPEPSPARKWPGTANLEVAHVWMRKGRWASPFVLDENPVAGITAFLTEPGTVVGPPHRLAANAGKSFIGSYVLGHGLRART